MYLFSRLATLTGGELKPMVWATEATAYVNAHSDHDVSLWRTDFGYPVGTVVWSARVASHEQLNAGFASLATDDGYHAIIDKGQEFMSAPPEDQLRQIVHGEPAADPPGIGAVTTVTTAVIGNGKYGEAIAWGTEMAQLVEKVTGRATLFLVDGYGTFGQVTWLSGAPDLAAVDAASDAINASEDYMSRLGAVGDLFVPGSGHRGLATRIA